MTSSESVFPSLCVHFIDLMYDYHAACIVLRRLILIAEKDTVYEKFPTPLINRLEKHFVLTETVLLDWQKDVLHSLTEWVEQFAIIPGTK